MLQFSTQNKIRINLCSIFFYKKIKFGSSYIAIVLTKQNPDQPMLQFSTHKKNSKQNSDQPMLQFSTQKKIGLTYVAIFHTKQNSDQPMLQFSTRNKIRINLCCNFPHKTKFDRRALACEDLFQSKLARTFLIVLGMPRQASLLSKQ